MCHAPKKAGKVSDRGHVPLVHVGAVLLQVGSGAIDEILGQGGIQLLVVVKGGGTGAALWCRLGTETKFLTEYVANDLLDPREQVGKHQESVPL
jgi:hypothetical protein